MTTHKKVKIIEATHPLYFAECIAGEGECEDEVIFTPIVAWRIEYSTESGNTDTEAFPITAEDNLNDVLGAIYSMETERWHYKDGSRGKGLEELWALYRQRESHRIASV